APAGGRPDRAAGEPVRVHLLSPHRLARLAHRGGVGAARHRLGPRAGAGVLELALRRAAVLRAVLALPRGGLARVAREPRALELTSRRPRWAAGTRARLGLPKAPAGSIRAGKGRLAKRA